MRGRSTTHWRGPSTRTVPEAEASFECVAVIAKATMGRQAVQQRGIATADYGLVGFDGGHQANNHVVDQFTPLAFAVFLQAAQTDVIFEGLLAIRQMSEL